MKIEEALKDRRDIEDRKDRAKHILEVFQRGQGKRITAYSSIVSVGALVCGRDFGEEFQQTTPLGFMNTGTLSATSERAHLKMIESRGITKKLTQHISNTVIRTLHLVKVD
ncbi:hypothetical protein ASD24_13295 [Paenibacillus sp. Root52]|uniref:hypothetical protein n=1 Tax=Paenibacillus sp. Root52 TaxID=1736552 RepID=UPI0006F33B17|nr:hypothetical protein [Paenibacillus sp. Root52]KQY83250.1 hypothetical protein ASD24_13295 [Paenibacillus sp. Root52]